MGGMATNFLCRRLRLRFSIRALLVVVTLVGTGCYYVASQANIVWQRKAMMQKITRDGGEVGGCSFGGVAVILGLDKQIPWFRRELGDVYVDQIVLHRSLNDRPNGEEFDELKRIFPEAFVGWR
jgi:hypothetical protein